MWINTSVPFNKKPRHHGEVVVATAQCAALHKGFRRWNKNFHGRLVRTRRDKELPRGAPRTGSRPFRQRLGEKSNVRSAITLALDSRPVDAFNSTYHGEHSHALARKKFRQEVPHLKWKAQQGAAPRGRGNGKVRRRRAVPAGIFGYSAKRSLTQERGAARSSRSGTPRERDTHVPERAENRNLRLSFLGLKRCLTRPRARHLPVVPTAAKGTAGRA